MICHCYSPLLSSIAANPLMPDQQVQKNFTNDPVFYGPDGNVLTEEESAFLWNETYYDDDDEYVFVNLNDISVKVSYEHRIYKRLLVRA